MLKKMIERTLRGNIQSQEIEKLTYGKVKMFRKQGRWFLITKMHSFVNNKYVVRKWLFWFLENSSSKILCLMCQQNYSFIAKILIHWRWGAQRLMSKLLGGQFFVDKISRVHTILCFIAHNCNQQSFWKLSWGGTLCHTLSPPSSIDSFEKCFDNIVAVFFCRNSPQKLLYLFDVWSIDDWIIRRKRKRLSIV